MKRFLLEFFGFFSLSLLVEYAVKGNLTIDSIIKHSVLSLLWSLWSKIIFRFPAKAKQNENTPAGREGNGATN
ncbi:hypothetical protein [Flavihumibacter solisilvae]|uniref:hypothetical protein n=1 Tax=Flavihumibacter solisilvae TaxID=1349421 RepID=UPI000AD6FA79|nr:hypothetical protein [Flavihumibacter solisilvae]